MIDYKKVLEQIQHNLKVFENSSLKAKDSACFEAIKYDVEEMLFELENGFPKGSPVRKQGEGA